MLCVCTVCSHTPDRGSTDMIWQVWILKKFQVAPLPCFGMCVLACFGMCVSARWYTHMFWHACSSTCLCFAFANTCDRCYTEGRAGHHKSTQIPENKCGGWRACTFWNACFTRYDNPSPDNPLPTMSWWGSLEVKQLLFFLNLWLFQKQKPVSSFFALKTNWKFKKHITSHTKSVTNPG